MPGRFVFSEDYNPEPERSLHRRRRARNFVTPPSSSSDTESSISVTAEDIEFETPPPPKPKMKLSDDGLPTAAQVPTGTLVPVFEAKSFKVDSGFYNLIRKDQFGGERTEDPASHINHFCDLCHLITQEGVTPDQLKHMLFPHSLKGKAYQWLCTLKGAQDWDTLVLAFYHRFFPPERTAMLRMQLTGFRQRKDESLYDTWERFKSIEKQIPHHGFTKGFIAMTFYGALNSESKRILDSAANGRFDSTDVEEAWDLIENMASHSIAYGQSAYSTVGAVSGDTLFQNAMTNQLEELKTQLANLQGASSSSQVQPTAAMHQTPPAIVAAHCENCGVYGHLGYTCQGTQEQVAAFQAYRSGNPYVPNSEPRQGYKQQYTNYNQPPPMNNPPTSSFTYVPPHRFPSNSNAPIKPTGISDLQDLKNIMMGMQKSQEHLIAQCAKDSQEKSNAIKNLETQLAQLATSQATRPSGQLPSQPTPNDNVFHTNSISLRSGTSYAGPAIPSDEAIVEDLPYEEEKELGEENDQPGANKGDYRSVMPSTDRQSPKKPAATPKTSSIGGRALKEYLKQAQAPPSAPSDTEIKLPFPGRMKSKKEGAQFGKFMEIMKNLQVSVPFTELITQVPAYTKFMKDILSKKRSLTDHATLAFAESCSAVLQNKVPPKLQDPGSFSIPCTIGPLSFERVLCDHGASVSVMPFAVCERLGVGELQGTTITLQMADRSIKRPMGILEDVPVRIGKYYFPVDFVVLDIPEDTQIQLILGRPFLCTAGAILDCKNGKLTLDIDGDKVVFCLSKVMRSPMVEESCHSIDIIDATVADLWDSSLSRDPFEDLMGWYTCAGDDFFDPGMIETAAVIDDSDEPETLQVSMDEVVDGDLLKKH